MPRGLLGEELKEDSSLRSFQDGATNFQYFGLGGDVKRGLFRFGGRHKGKFYEKPLDIYYDKYKASLTLDTAYKKTIP